MPHEEPLPQCEKVHCEMKHTIEKHIDESGPVRSDVAKHNEQILTLGKAHEASMQDISDIKKEIKDIGKAIDGCDFLPNALALLINWQRDLDCTYSVDKFLVANDKAHCVSPLRTGSKTSSYGYAWRARELMQCCQAFQLVRSEKT